MDNLPSRNSLHEGVERRQIILPAEQVDRLVLGNRCVFQVVEVEPGSVFGVPPDPGLVLLSLGRKRDIVVWGPEICANQAPPCRQNENIIPPECADQFLIQFAEHVFRKLYQELVGAFGWDNVFILSAGWGLIRADFWTPDYNVTFSPQGKKDKPWVWRNTKDRSWLDFNHLKDAPITQDEPIHLFGGKDYLPTFYALVEAVPGRKIVHYKGNVERRSSFDYEKYEGSEKNRTWHYRAAKEFVAGRAPQENQVPQ